MRSRSLRVTPNQAPSELFASDRVLRTSSGDEVKYRLEPPVTLDDRIAPRAVFEDILKYSVIPTIDLIVDCGFGVVLLRRKVPPYKNKWALPGLRILKGDEIFDAIKRVARLELGIQTADLSSPTFVFQQSVRFRSEMQRQDISSTYAITTRTTSFVVNANHYSAIRVVNSLEELPDGLGRMYVEPLQRWYSIRRQER